MKMIKFVKYSLLILVLTSSIVFAAKKGWWDRLFPEKTPQVISSQGKSTPLIDPPKEAVNLQESFSKVADAIMPAVVNISAVHISQVSGDPHQFFFGDPHELFRHFFGETPRKKTPKRERRTEGTGSGVIIDPEGYILTNNHVIQGADQLNVTLSTEKTYKGKVIGTDPRTDLAVIRIKSSNPFPFAPLGDSSKVRIGDWVLAIGSPFGLQQTMTAGIISAIRQSLNIEGRWFRGLLQTDAAINRGNSGGPLVNLRGEVVGINAAIYAPTGVFSGIGFAIPVNRAKGILKDLIEKGYVERSWMGVEIIAVDEIIADQFGLSSEEGALVNNVIPDSPADKAGLKRGDVVLEFDGKKIKTVAELQDIVSQTPPKKTVRVKVNRGGSTKNIKLTTAVMPSQVALEGRPGGKSQQDAITETEWLGAKFANLTDGHRRKYSISEKVYKGVIAIDVPAGSMAADAGINEGDVVGAVNRKKTNDVEDLEKVKSSVDAKDGLVLDVLRRGRWIYLSYKSLQ